MSEVVEFLLDADEAMRFCDGLFDDLVNAPEHVRQSALDILNVAPELVCFESGIATGATLPILLKPSQWLMDFRAAIRAGNVELFVV